MPKGSKLQVLFRFMLLPGLLCAALFAHAGSNVNVTLTGVGGAQYGYGSNYSDGEYLMPYYVSINNAPPATAICDDYNHHVTVGEQWVGTIHSFNDLTGTRFGQSYSQQYHEAAWLASQVTSTSSLATVAAVQFAIWRLFSGNTPLIGGENIWLQAASSAAANNFWGMDFSHWQILTPFSPTSPQEYLLYIPSIPEPSVLLDLMVGLIAFTGIYIVKRKRALSARA
jgi:hypothetical protein